MYHVLVPVGADSHSALSKAACVAAFPGAPDDLRVSVAHQRHGYGNGAPASEEVHTVQLAVRLFEREGVPVESVGFDGPFVAGILSLAEERDVDHIVMGSQEWSSTSDRRPGNEPVEVARYTTVPVTIVGRVVPPAVEVEPDVSST